MTVFSFPIERNTGFILKVIAGGKPETREVEGFAHFDGKISIAMGCTP
jgi:hypothetical protein